MASSGVVNGASKGIVNDASRGVSSGSGGGDVPIYSYGGGGGGGGYGGGSGERDAEDIQKETQRRLNETVGIYDKRGGDLSELGVQNLSNIKDQMSKNDELLSQTNKQNMRQVEWQPNQQKEQSTLSSLRNRAGNSLYGSGLVDLMEGMGRVDDMNDVQLINAWRQNSDAAYSNWYQANQELVNDYVDQVLSIKDEFSKLYGQYWTAILNIDPYVGSGGIIPKSVKGQSWTTENVLGDEYTLNAAPNILASKALQELFDSIPDRGSAVNPYTREFVRPDSSNEAPSNPLGLYQSRGDTSSSNAYTDTLNMYSASRMPVANYKSSYQPVQHGGSNQETEPAAKQANETEKNWTSPFTVRQEAEKELRNAHTDFADALRSNNRAAIKEAEKKLNQALFNVSHAMLKR